MEDLNQKACPRVNAYTFIWKIPDDICMCHVADCSVQRATIYGIRVERAGDLFKPKLPIMCLNAAKHRRFRALVCVTAAHKTGNAVGTEVVPHRVTDARTYVVAKA